MRLEEYVLKRKKEDGINEYDVEKRTENMRICVNYIFEYYCNYLDTRAADKLTVLHDQKVDKYRNIIREYSEEVREWLVALYASHAKYMHKNLMTLITDSYFLLYNSESEFRAISYEVYPIAAKKFKFLEGQSEALYAFIKDAHRVRNLPYDDKQEVFISEEINQWIAETQQKHGVNIYNFCCEWVSYFFEYPNLWPKGHKKRSEYFDKRDDFKNFKMNESIYWDYDYRQKSNLFGLDSLYRNMPKKSFTRGRKQEFEAVLMYCWLHNIDSDEAYWCNYSESVL